MARIEAECYAMYEAECKAAHDAAVFEANIKMAQAQIAASMKDLMEWSRPDEPSDAEKVADFASYETTWKDRWQQFWKL